MYVESVCCAVCCVMCAVCCVSCVVCCVLCCVLVLFGCVCCVVLSRVCVCACVWFSARYSWWHVYCVLYEMYHQVIIMAKTLEHSICPCSSMAIAKEPLIRKMTQCMFRSMFRVCFAVLQMRPPIFQESGHRDRNNQQRHKRQ